VGGSFARRAGIHLEAIRKYVNPRKKSEIARKILSIVKGMLRTRPEVAKALEKAGSDWFWRYLYGRGDCRSQGRRPKADPGVRVSCREKNPGWWSTTHGGDPSLRTMAFSSRSGARGGQETRALPFEDRYGDDRLGIATGDVECFARQLEMQAFAALPAFFRTLLRRKSSGIPPLASRHANRRAFLPRRWSRLRALGIDRAL